VVSESAFIVKLLGDGRGVRAVIAEGRSARSRSPPDGPALAPNAMSVCAPKMPGCGRGIHQT